MSDIDKRIAVEVMGRTVIDVPDDGYYIVKENNWRYPQDSFEPSTNIADAWLVVEKMRELGYWWEGYYSNEGHFIMFYNETANGESLPVESMPMAICLAALQALGVNDG